MSDYAQVVRTIQQEAERQSPQLRNPACQSIFLLHAEPTAKVCLFFHGFTAAPFQFASLAQILYKAGYNVLVPLLPGHGLAGDWGPFSPPPLPTETQVYEDFAQEWLNRARALGQKLVVGGLSGGATLAAWLALEHPRAIDKTLLLAPYLGSSDRVIQQMTRQINRYQEWLRPPAVAEQTLQRPGYRGFDQAAMQVWVEMGQSVLVRSQYEDAASLFIISSVSDRPNASESSSTSNRSSASARGLANDDPFNTEHRLYFERILRYQPHTWHLCFEQVHDIPQTMLTLEEGNPHVFMLMRMAKGYIESDLTWAEVAEIGHRMARGQVFPAAVQQLGLSQRVSPDMPTVMAVMDKRQFLDLRQRQRVLH